MNCYAGSEHNFLALKSEPARSQDENSTAEAEFSNMSYIKCNL
jgi:hypothetical protein